LLDCDTFSIYNALSYVQKGNLDRCQRTWLPILVRVNDTQADFARGIDVWVKYYGLEYTFGWSLRVRVGKYHGDSVNAFFPGCIFFAWFQYDEVYDLDSREI
jgi:hypothetical protein